jgi:hypothetical protein
MCRWTCRADAGSQRNLLVLCPAPCGARPHSTSTVCCAGCVPGGRGRGTRPTATASAAPICLFSLSGHPPPPPPPPPPPIPPVHRPLVLGAPPYRPWAPPCHSTLTHPIASAALLPSLHPQRRVNCCNTREAEWLVGGRSRGGGRPSTCCLAQRPAPGGRCPADEGLVVHQGRVGERFASSVSRVGRRCCTRAAGYFAASSSSTLPVRVCVAHVPGPAPGPGPRAQPTPYCVAPAAVHNPLLQLLPDYPRDSLDDDGASRCALEVRDCVVLWAPIPGHGRWGLGGEEG